MLGSARIPQRDLQRDQGRVTGPRPGSTSATVWGLDPLTRASPPDRRAGVDWRRYRRSMSESSTSVPARDRPIMPEGYGVPETDDGLVEWSAVEQLLVEAPQYWMSTTRADGRFRA